MKFTTSVVTQDNIETAIFGVQIGYIDNKRVFDNYDNW